MCILRSGHCSGNFITNLDDLSVKDLDQDVCTLMEIAHLSPRRSEYHAMEKNNIASLNLEKNNLEKNNIASLNMEAFNCSEVLTYMSILRLKDIEKEVALVGNNLQIDWASLKEINKSLSMRAYFRFHQFYSSDCLLNSDEEKDFLINASYNVNKGKCYPCSNEFGNESLRGFQKLGCMAQNEHEWTKKRVTAPKTAEKFKSLESLLSSSSDSLSGICQNAESPENQSFISCIIEGSILSGSVTKSYNNVTNLIDSACYNNFRNIFLNMYALAQNTPSHDIERKTSFGYLLNWIASEQPDNIKYLYFLLHIALHPSSKQYFPSPPDHRVYYKPDEFEYNQSDIMNAIKECLTVFSERKHGYDKREYQKWLTRKNDHDNEVNSTQFCLKEKIRKAWENQTDLSISVLEKPKIRDPDLLKSKIGGMFERWKKSIELRTFISSLEPKFNEFLSNWQSIDFDSLVCVNIQSPTSYKKLSFMLNSKHDWESHLVQTRLDEIFDVDNEFEDHVRILGTKGAFQK